MNTSIIPGDNVEISWWLDKITDKWNMKMVDLKTKKETSTWLHVESPHVSKAFHFMYDTCIKELR